MERMTPQEIITLTTVVITAVLTVAGFVIGRLTGKHTEGKAEGVIQSDLGYVKSSLDDIKRGQQEQAQKSEVQHLEVISRLTSVEASAKQAHKRIDRIEEVIDK